MKRLASLLCCVAFAAAVVPSPAGAAERAGEGKKERTRRKLTENIPPANPLPKAHDRSTSKPALGGETPGASSTWTSLGPAPIPNGQTEGRIDPVSGRVTAIAVHPENPAIAYVGTAQGGLYRTINGGNSWRQLMDNAEPSYAGTPLAIGAVTIDPTDPNTVLVGTGEGNFSGDSFFGCGLYIITNASGSTPTVNGPYNLTNLGEDVFTGRSITSIAVDPNNHNNVFIGTTTGFGGIIAETYPFLPQRGLYRTTNAFDGVTNSGIPRFKRLTIEATENNESITSVVIEPGNASTLICAVHSQNGSGTGGIYRTTNALVTNPSFTRTRTLPDETNVKLAIHKRADLITVYAATEEGSPNGRLYKSTNGGVSFGDPLPAADGFAGEQGFYNIAIAVHPNTADRVYLGGQVGRNIFLFSDDGGLTFDSSVEGLHVDTHAIALSPSNPSTIYHGNDGGIWRSQDDGRSWRSLNNETFSATQFQDLAVHPTDRNFTLGGTQDNGTELIYPDGTIKRVDFGDGGYSLIDQNATDTQNVTMYHTYFNETGLILGTARVLRVDCATEGQWSFHGAFEGTPEGPYCDGSFDTQNGINLNDAVNFYAPQALGPGNPNTWYFGSDKLYRSTNRADTAIVASQLLDPGVPISAIAISPQDDNVRLVGLNNGKVFATRTGSNALVQIAGPGATNGTSSTPNAPVGRIAIDPNNSSVAYLCFGGYGFAHVWKTTNLNDAVVEFEPMSRGLPDAPVNAIAIDPVTGGEGSSSDVYVGTDVGVYYSGDRGDFWTEYGRGFPRVAVFGLEIQSPARLVRAATHGRGLYEMETAVTVVPDPTPTPTPDPNSDMSTKLRNVSTRGPVRTGEEVMIAGFIVTGESNKQVVLRAIAPSLTRLGVVGALADPTLSLNDANGTLLAFNDDYTQASANDRGIIAANRLTPTDSRESALVGDLSPGIYTALLRGKTNGAALVEVYDTTPTAPSRLVNISTRLKVEPGDNGALIAGFIVGAPANQPGTPVRVVIRALGPSLKSTGVAGTLEDTTLDLYRGSQLIFSNDNWKANSPAEQQELNGYGLTPAAEKESAVVYTLEPGNYSAVVRGKNNTAGVGLVEVYQVSQ